MDRPVMIKNDLHPRHSRDAWTQPRLRNTRRIIASIIIFVLLAASSLGAAAWMGIQSRINTRALEIPTFSHGVAAVDTDPIDPNDGRPLDILVLGQDTRGGDAGNAEIGGHDPNDKDNHQADTAMVVHISADRDRIEVVSLPRDSIIDQPECATTNGTAPARQDVMLNSTFAYGWSQGGDLASAVSCELAAVNQATGLDVHETVVVDFAGMARMIDAVDGVEICVPARVDDVNTGLRLDPGIHKLNGVDATQYARVRHGVEGADGSDIMRTVRQQTVVKALLDQALSNGMLSNPTRLYSLGVSVLDSLNLSQGLASAPTLVGLAYSLRDLDMDEIQTMTVPVVPWPADPNRVVWTEEAAGIWDALRNDRPLGVDVEPAKTPADAGEDPTINGGDGGRSPSADASGQALPGGADTQTGMNGSGSDGDGEAVSGIGGSTPVADADGYAMDEATGLLKDTETGDLKDPATGGRVDPKTGYVYDPVTGGVVGLAYQYVNTTICKVE